MNVGLDMIAVQYGGDSPIAQYVRRLADELAARYCEHTWYPHFHQADADLSSGHVVRGQSAFEQSADRLDVWLTTSTLDWLDNYLPPNAPVGDTRLAGLVYDLAPALVGERFLERPNHSFRYQRALQTLPRYDLLLTVSEATRRDLIAAFGVDERRVVAIGPFCDADLRRDEISQADADLDVALRAAGIERPFVLFLAADYEERSVAVASAMLVRLPAVIAEEYQFVISCHLPIERRLAWQAELERRGQKGRIVLVEGGTSSVSRLCSRCEVLVDASPQEGSGLLLLNALRHRVAAIVGSRSWHAELVGDVALLADVDQPGELAARLAPLLGDKVTQAKLRARANNVVRGCDITSVADRAMEALIACQRGTYCALAPESAGSFFPFGHRTVRRRPRPPLAFFSPLLPQRTGISDYSERLLAALVDHYWIDLYHDHNYLPQLSANALFGCRDHRLFERFRRVTEYAGVVYQMANTHYCAYLYEMLLKEPGVVVLHDYALPEFHFGYALRPGTPADFIAGEIARESPELADDYRANAAAWRAEPAGIMEACIRRGLTFNRRVLDAAAMLVVHDPWGAEKVCRECPQLAPRVRVVPHGASVYVAPPDEKRTIRQRFRFADDDLILSCFGILNGAKYHAEAIEALAALAGDFPTARLIFAGGDLNEGREQSLVERLGLGDRVQFFGHAAMKTFLDLMQITDVAMNLRRPPTRGETSGALLSLLSAGIPTIVTDVDTFSSYPDAVVCKIGPLAAGDRSLEHALRSLLDKPGRRQAMSQVAVRHVAEVHNWQRVARLYADAIEETAETLRRRKAA